MKRIKMDELFNYGYMSDDIKYFKELFDTHDETSIVECRINTKPLVDEHRILDVFYDNEQNKKIYVIKKWNK